MIDWIFVRSRMPQDRVNQTLLVTDGKNVAINEYENGVFKPIRIIKGHANFLPVWWYDLNDVRLPEG